MNRIIFVLFILIDFSLGAQTWYWAKSSKGGGEGWGICTDPAGNSVITGYFTFPSIAFSTYTLYTMSPTGGQGSFLVKYDASGNVLWAKSPYGNSQSTLVKMDATGNVYMAGSLTSNLAFPTTTLTFSGANSDYFLAKYDANGNFVWAKSFGASWNPTIYGLTVDPLGNPVMCGIFYSPTVAIGSVTISSVGFKDFFIAKLDPSGNTLWAKSFGGSGDDYAKSVTTDANGNIYATGSFDSPFITMGTNTLVNTGYNDVFINKLDANGNLMWASKMGSLFTDLGNYISADALGNTYVTGYYYSANFTAGTYTLPNAGAEDFFLAKYDTNGNIQWLNGGGGAGTDQGYCVKSLTNGVFLTGQQGSTPMIIGTYTLIPPVFSEPMFVAQYDFNGNVICAATLSGGGDDKNEVDINQGGDAYITGDFMATMVVGTTTLVMTPGGENAFIAKFNCASSTDIQKRSDHHGISIYPNPSNGSFNINYEGQNNNVELIILNSIGQKVFDKKINQGKNELRTEGLPNGLYNLSILQDNTPLQSGKIIIE